MTDDDTIYGKIYMIRARLEDGSLSEQVYIGSTTKRLGTRLTEHKSNHRRYKAGKARYVTSSDIMELGEPEIELLEAMFCTPAELRRREGEYQHKMQAVCINKKVEGRVRHNERARDWYHNNKDKRQLYYQLNKERLNQYYLDHREERLAYQTKYRQMKKEARQPKQKVQIPVSLAPLPPVQSKPRIKVTVKPRSPTLIHPDPSS